MVIYIRHLCKPESMEQPGQTPFPAIRPAVLRPHGNTDIQFLFSDRLIIALCAIIPIMDSCIQVAAAPSSFDWFPEAPGFSGTVCIDIDKLVSVQK